MSNASIGGCPRESRTRVARGLTSLLVSMTSLPIALGLILILILILSPPLSKARYSGISQSVQQRLDTRGACAALPLGMIFALTSCPVSAALYFGSLIPLAIQARSRVLLPGVYGLGTALPAFGIRAPPGPERPFGRQGLRRPLQGRVVGPASDGAAFSRNRRLLQPEVHLRHPVTPRVVLPHAASKGREPCLQHHARSAIFANTYE